MGHPSVELKWMTPILKEDLLKLPIGPAENTVGFRQWRRVVHEELDAGLYLAWAFKSPLEGLCITCPEEDGEGLFIWYLTGRGLSVKGNEIVEDLVDIAKALGLAPTLAGAVRSYARFRFFRRFGFLGENAPYEGVGIRYG